VVISLKKVEVTQDGEVEISYLCLGVKLEDKRYLVAEN
jgi:hypothetical protein